MTSIGTVEKGSRFSSLSCSPKATVNSLNIKLAKVRLCVAPKVGRVLAHSNRAINSALEKGTCFLENCAFSKKRDGTLMPEMELQHQRKKASNALGKLLGVMSIGTLASSIASMAAPPAAVATLVLGLLTLGIRQAQKGVILMTLRAAKAPFNTGGTPPSTQSYIDVISAMKAASVKYIETSGGLKTRTDLALEAYAHAPNQDTKNKIEGILRHILAAKATVRDAKASFGLMPAVAGRVSSSIVVKNIGTGEDGLLPIDQNPENPREPNVIGLLQSKGYASQTQRPAVAMTLRNLVWNTGDQKDWVDLISARKAFTEKESKKISKYAERDEAYNHEIMTKIENKTQKFMLDEDGNNTLVRFGLTDQHSQIQSYLTASIGSLGVKALDSLIKSDVQKANKLEFDKMTPAGQAVIYAVQKLIQESSQVPLIKTAELGTSMSSREGRIQNIGQFNVDSLKSALDTLEA